MKLLLLMLLIPSLVHARPLIIQVQNQTDIDIRDFSAWANAVIDDAPRVKGLRRVRSVKVIERNDVYGMGIVNPIDLTEFRDAASINLDNFTDDLGQNILGPVLRRANIWSLPGRVQNGTSFYGGLAYVTPYPWGYTNPQVWASGISYTGKRNSEGQDRRLQSYITILHEAFHTLGVAHQPTFCNVMYPSLAVSYSSCRQGIEIDPLSNDRAATTVFLAVRDFRRKLKRCRDTGRGKRSCISELVKAKNRLPIREVHKCEATH